MKHVLLISVASAALAAGLAVADAQTAGDKAGGAPSQGAGGGAGAMPHAGQQPGMKTPGGGADAAGAAMKTPKNAAAQKESGDEAPASKTAGSGKEGGAQPGEKAAGKERGELDNGGAKTAAPNDRSGMNERNAPNQRNTATDNHNGRQWANLTPEVRTKVNSEIAHAQIREAPNVNINVHVGGVAPREITEYWEPVPSEIITIVPAWSAYRVVRIGGQILIIDPNTFEIVEVVQG